MGLDGGRLAAALGALAGLVFVLVNAGGLEPPWPVVARVVGVVASLVVLAAVLSGRGGAPAVHRPPPAAWRTYWFSVLGEVVALLAGTRLLDAAGRGDLGVAWVAVVVGVHFLPFARAFAAREYAALGWALVALGLLALVLGLAGAPSWVVPLVAGTGSGAALLVFAGWRPLTGRVGTTR